MNVDEIEIVEDERRNTRFLWWDIVDGITWYIGSW